jgi:excisionase family DNA binding protein
MGKKLTLDAAASELGISKTGVRRLISSGELRAYKVGRKLVRIDADDIAKVLRPIVPSQWVLDTPPQFVRAHENRRAGKAEVEVPSDDPPAQAPASPRCRSTQRTRRRA